MPPCIGGSSFADIQLYIGVYEAVGARGRPRRNDSVEKVGIACPLKSASSRKRKSSDDDMYQNMDIKPCTNSPQTIADRLLPIDRLVWQSLQSNEETQHCLKLDSSGSERSLLTLLVQLVYLATGKATGTTSYNQDESFIDGTDVLEGNTQKDENRSELALTNSQLMQLMELAFALHPFLSLIVSKTVSLFSSNHTLAVD